MNIEQALRNYKKQKSIVETIEIRILAYETMLKESGENIFEMNFPSELGMPRSPNRSGSPTERAIVSIECSREDIKELIKEEKSRLFWPKLEMEQIEKSLNGLTTWEKYIIECKYFDGMTWRNIAISFNKQFPQKNDLTEIRLQQMNGDAIIKLKDILTPFYDQFESILKII